jgi:hypothetical protein
MQVELKRCCSTGSRNDKDIGTISRWTIQWRDQSGQMRGSRVIWIFLPKNSETIVISITMNDYNLTGVANTIPQEDPECREN